MADDNYDEDLFDDLYADDAPPPKPKSPTPQPVSTSSNLHQQVPVSQEDARIPVMNDDTNGHSGIDQGGNDGESESYGPIGIKEDG